MNRQEILNEAMKITTSTLTKSRASVYGSPEDSFSRIAAYWSEYLGVDISAHDVGIMMIFLKIARIKSGKLHLDSYVDIAGYAACTGEIAANSQQVKKED